MWNHIGRCFLIPFIVKLEITFTAIEQISKCTRIYNLLSINADVSVRVLKLIFCLSHKIIARSIEIKIGKL